MERLRDFFFFSKEWGLTVLDPSFCDKFLSISWPGIYTDTIYLGSIFVSQFSWNRDLHTEVWLGSTFWNNTLNKWGKQKWAERKVEGQCSYNKGPSRSLGELWSWNGPLEISYWGKGLGFLFLSLFVLWCCLLLCRCPNLGWGSSLS